ncbi:MULTISPECIES: glycine cleavage system aminomethyltransferase GcvT [unclassified Pseudodesulfovibrio]|uniref:glycine cleavage system aminomethyltransferase GcvT n=1 Tax=unclassified Pseudodesulfovibrio TaxID=2661612 RepID=UPI000FEB9302|nr:MULTISPECIES: glycine cleavage system aminomethyltransferase GcvT [unclassified Pseudodesulfovibrio]MCJ2163831.1 glycine cleavage system aminomethyltransferase GcvT [Pseudodesulfovibrio sp. S3-i]RWU05922.1 glycine cleavage system aminomethyltransferase GcvT [Pseudodesulfovibrio sp. S3]
MKTLATTPLSGWHRENGAKMAPFAGFDMPVQYKGIIIEHNHTRNKAGIFDICHMGEFKLSGSGSKDGLNKIVSHDLNTLAPGKCRYGFLLNQSGGIKDDLIIYCLAEDEYMLVVNGACRQKDFDQIQANLPDGLEFTDISDETGKIDVQGPESLAVLNDLLGTSWNHLKYFSFEKTDCAGFPMIVSRTGYTGELGYELYLPADKALEIWKKLAADERVEPVGLGARDTLRLEIGYPLYGQDLDEDHTPRESGGGFFLKKETNYIGKSGLDKVRESLIALSIEGRRTARHNDEVLLPNGERTGIVTSGSFAPSLGHCIALAYVRAEDEDKDSFIVKTARTEIVAKKAALPFYKDGTARIKID